jgi:outer membrane lipoprotein carrier protein
MFYRFATLLLLSLFPFSLMADEARERLNYFFKSVESMTAEFIQEVRDEDGQLIREASGSFVLLRPGRFRWDYTVPNAQSIISDGQYLWIYDKDLAQVTVKELGKALGASPIMLLSEPRRVDEDFIVLGSREADGVAWLELSPKLQDTDFRKLEIGLNNQAIKEMVLYDQFGQRTQISFEQVLINPRVTDSRFNFNIPPGVDVIGLDRP